MDTTSIQLPLPFEPPKLCECGCGLPAPIARRTDRGVNNTVKGMPMRFRRGHSGGRLRVYDPNEPRWDRWRKRNHALYNARERLRRRDPTIRAKVYALNANRRARKAGACGYASAVQTAARWAMWGNLCWMCGKPATCTDHVIPLAKGGTNWPANLRPACQSCNSSKGAKKIHLLRP